MELPHIHDAPLTTPYSPDFESLKLPAVQAFEVVRSPQIPALEPTPLPSLNLSLSANGRSDRDPFAKSHPVEHTNPRPIQAQLYPRNSTTSTDSSSPTEVGSALSFDDYLRRKDTNTTVDENDDRLAAEALCGLGQVDSNHSHDGRPSQDQPLLSLLSSRHPWIGGLTNGSLSAYSSIKQFSPRPVQYGANLVESTVGYIGRGTGVEGNVRRYLGGQADARLQLDAPDVDEQPSKRRRTLEVERPQLPPITQLETHRSSYESSREMAVAIRPMTDENTSRAVFRPTANRSWSTQLLISTSGLGAALNEASLRSLRYCLNFIRGTNAHINGLVRALKDLLAELQRSPHYRQQYPTSEASRPAMQHPGAREHSAWSDGQVTERIRQLNDEIWNTVKSVCNNISQYTGGALPEGAARFVKQQLTSIPARWQRTAPQEAPADAHSDVLSSGQRMVAFANEGLDMMDQVHNVVDDTIKSAEKWLERVGRRSQQDEQYQHQHQQLEHGVGSLQLSQNGEHIYPPPQLF